MTPGLLRAERGTLGAGLVSAAGLYLLLVAVELALILWLNGGLLVYTLDDAYIHLALAENLLQGHYGVNPGEVSAPSSSIVWPFLLAPFSWWIGAPLVLNVLCGLGALFVASRIVERALPTGGAHRTLISAVLLGAYVLAANLVGLTFIGMEHTLQVLAVTAVLWGMIVVAEEERAPRWLLPVIVLASLVRYENLAVCVAAVGFLLLRREYRVALGAAAGMAVLHAAFSGFLLSQGLDALPTSVLAKSSVADGGLRGLVGAARLSLDYHRGLLLAVGGLLCAVHAVWGGGVPRRQLGAAAALAVGLHLAAGRYGWYHRYEIYIWAFTLLTLLYLYGSSIALRSESGRSAALKLGLTAALGLGVLAMPYVEALTSLPVAANNIYEQQYQMHRFAAEYHEGPVAIHDLGYVAYRNPHYVLDLAGLASAEALHHRRTAQDGAWMDRMARARGADLAMIYPFAFRSIPEHWVKLGDLHLSRRRVTPARSEVAFFATTPAAAERARQQLAAFAGTLPPGVRFTFAEGGADG